MGSTYGFAGHGFAHARVLRVAGMQLLGTDRLFGVGLRDGAGATGFAFDMLREGNEIRLSHT
jgi:hypothetical protein